jgi:hypothetical protein
MGAFEGFTRADSYLRGVKFPPDKEKPLNFLAWGFLLCVFLSTRDGCSIAFYEEPKH